eukprot:scaffold22955_cov30-Prasinocladus_malaysianus.AAC.1
MLVELAEIVNRWAKIRPSISAGREYAESMGPQLDAAYMLKHRYTEVKPSPLPFASCRSDKQGAMESMLTINVLNATMITLLQCLFESHTSFTSK